MLVGVPKGCQNKGSLWQHHKFAIIQRMTSKTSRNLFSDLPAPSPSRPKYFSSCLTPSLAFPSPAVRSISWSMLLGLPYDVIVAAVRGMAMTHNCAKTVWADDAHCHAWVLNRLNIIMVTLLSLPTENLPNLNLVLMPPCSMHL